METLGLFILLGIFTFILIKSADFIEDAFILISSKLKISEFLLGFIFLGVISSLPEIAIAIRSNDEVPELSAGNLFGGTLVLLTLVLAMATLRFKDVHFKGKFNEKEILTALALMSLMILTSADKKLTVLESALLFFLYLSYCVQLFIEFKRKGSNIPESELISTKKTFLLLFQAIAGIGLIILAANNIVEIVREVGRVAGVNEAFIGLLVLGFGTNLPEMAILVNATNFDRRKLAIGNFLGSATVNVAILGILGMLSNGFEYIHFISIIPVMVILAITIACFGIFSYTGRRLSAIEAYILIGLYVSFIVTEALILVLE